MLDERGRRRFAAAEALAAGRGGIIAVSRITGIARSTIGRGLSELRGEAEPEAAPGRVRRKGAGRPALVQLVGDFRNGGREYRPKGRPEPVRVHDFIIPELGRAAPYGVYDIADNAGWVSVGIDNDTASFAVNSIRRWWKTMGRARYPHAAKLLITADCGGSNGVRVRLWKRELQALADELGLAITVCHLPPGTSKWNKIEHRLFSFITQNWRGKPLVSLQTIVQLIAATTTATGLKVRCAIDRKTYPAGVKVTDREMDAIDILRHSFHGEWNYTIRPKTPVSKR